MKYDLMKYDLVFGYFGWVGIDLDICFDVLGFSVTVCTFQILMMFVFFNGYVYLTQGKVGFLYVVMEHLRMNGGILGKLDTVDVVEVICIVFLFQQIMYSSCIMLDVNIYIYIYIYESSISV